MSTSAGWDGVLTGITNEDNTTCDKPNPDLGLAGTCGSATVGITFLLSYLVISFLIVINMYIAVILENYSQATEDVQEGLTDDDYDMYYEIWQQFDPDGSQYIRYNEDFVCINRLATMYFFKPFLGTISYLNFWMCWSPRCKFTSPINTR